MYEHDFYNGVDKGSVKRHKISSEQRYTHMLLNDAAIYLCPTSVNTSYHTFVLARSARVCPMHQDITDLTWAKCRDRHALTKVCLLDAFSLMRDVVQRC